MGTGIVTLPARCIPFVGNAPARWRLTGKSLDELLLPSVAAVRDALVTASPALPDRA